jgi:hypothetical protein
MTQGITPERTRMHDPFRPFALWLAWLDSHDGRLFRRAHGGQETDLDLAALIPTPPTQAVFTVGDLRAIVAAGRRDPRRPPMANQPQSQPPQPQQAAAPQSAEQQLLQAGASQQHLQQARALGLDPQQTLALLLKYLPVVLDLVQQFRGGQPGGGQPAAAAP